MKKIRIHVYCSFIFTLLFSIYFNTNLALAETKLNNYNIQLTFNERTETLSSKETLSFRNSYKSELTDMVFHLYPDSYGSPKTIPAIGYFPTELEKDQIGDITIGKVLINDKEVSFTQDNQILKIKPNTNIKPNEEVKVYIEFTLKLPKGNNRLGYYNEIYSFTNWYPILSIYDENNKSWDETPFNPIGESNYSEVADYDVTIETSKGMKIASTGVDNTITIEDGKKIFNIQAKNVRDFVFIASPKFNVVSKTIDGIKVNSFYIDDSNSFKEKKQAETILEVSVNSLKCFSDTFGKYPYKEFDIVETYLSGGAMEYPQLIQMGNYYFNPDTNYLIFNQSFPFEIEAAVHEVAHQWWYVTVGNNEFKESFLDESLTTYSTAYYFEKQFGKYNQKSAFSKFRLFMYPDKSESLPINSSVDKFESWSDYSMTIYEKGPLVFEDLRQRVGDEKLINTLKTYYNEFKFKNANIADFLKIISEISGEETENVIKNALSSKNYFPENIILSQEERNTAFREIEKTRILNSEKQYGISIDSIIARGILGEKIYVVRPSNLSKEESLQIDEYLSMLSDSFKNQYGFEIIIKEDSALTAEELKNENLMVLCNPENNSILNSINTKLPISFTSYGLMTNDSALYSKNISGQFISENPFNKNKVIYVMFWTKDLDLNSFQNYRSFYDEAPYQFNINIDNKKFFYGRY